MEKISSDQQWKLWSYVALHSFGGPAGQIAVMHRVVVEERKLISEERFLHALNFCMLLPGPEAQQLATYLGWLMGKWRGGLLAGGLFVLPGFLCILLLSYLYLYAQDVTLIQGIFYGLKPAIIAVVLAALMRIASKSLKNPFHWMLALSSFVALFFFNLSFPLVIVMAALLGLIYGRLFVNHPLVTGYQLPLPHYTQTLTTLFTWLGIWIAPAIFTLIIFGEDSTLHVMNVFFSKMAMVTFGGAYAVLTYVAQKAVEVYGWIEPGEMLDALAMAETTPGPLIQTVQFVGFMGAYRFPDTSSPYFSALLASILTTWMTYAPCFLWIFTLAPYVEFLRGQKILSDALAAISAAVVGVILNLSLWFVLKSLFLESITSKEYGLDFEYPHLSSIDYYATGICLIAMLLQFKFKQGLFRILGVSMILGILVKLVV